MSKLSLIEKIASCYSKGEAMPIKGHAKVILTDVRDGTQKVVESDNMVTSAVASLFSKNWSRLANFASSNINPINKLFSGVMCFQNEITEQADNYNPPADDVNPMIAHAGDAPNDTASTLRGSPVPADFEITDTSIKQVWFWPTTAGNGTIRNVSLCAGSVMGNMGLKPFNNEFNPLSTFGNDQLSTNITAWNVEVAKQYPFNISDDGQTSWSVWLDGTTFTEYTMRHDYFKFGIMRGTRDWQDVANRSATVRSGNNRFVFDDDDYYYIARATSATSMQIDKVSKTTFEVTQADCTFSGVSLWTGAVESYKNGSIRIFAFDGTHLYYPNSVGNQFLKLNLEDNSDVLSLDGEITIHKGEVAPITYGGEQFASPLVINAGLILGDNYIINGARTYPIAQTRRIGCHSDIRSDKNWLWLVKKGASVYANGKQTSDSTSRWTGQSNVLNQMFLSTINNIDPVVKSTSQTMSIIYTLREV